MKATKMLTSDSLKAMQTKEYKMAEEPSGSALASARGMAKLAAAMANQGQVKEI